jgi:hypothetical protein
VERVTPFRRLFAEEVLEGLEYQAAEDDETQDDYKFGARRLAIGNAAGSIGGSSRTNPDEGDGRLVHLLGLLGLDLVLGLAHAVLLGLRELGVAAALLECLGLWLWCQLGACDNGSYSRGHTMVLDLVKDKLGNWNLEVVSGRETLSSWVKGAVSSFILAIN